MSVYNIMSCSAECVLYNYVDPTAMLDMTRLYKVSERFIHLELKVEVYFLDPDF